MFEKKYFKWPLIFLSGSENYLRVPFYTLWTNNQGEEMGKRSFFLVCINQGENNGGNLAPVVIRKQIALATNEYH